MFLFNLDYFLYLADSEDTDLSQFNCTLRAQAPEPNGSSDTLFYYLLNGTLDKLPP